MEKRNKTALESGVLILIVAAILVAVNALSALGVYARDDVTKSERFTLSKGSGNLLRSMKQQLTVDAYVTKGLPKLDAFVRDLRSLLQEYKNAGGGKLEYTIIEAKDEDSKKKAKDAGLIEQPFGEASDTDDEIHHKVGVLTGHDEIKLTEENLTPHNMGKYAIQGIITQNFPFYSFQDVDLKNGDSEIPDELDGLIITQPGKDLTEKELRRIDQFVMKGKSLAVFAGAVNLKAGDATMSATLSPHGLDKLLDGYGISMNKDAVIDRRGVHLIVPTSGGMAQVDMPQVLEVQDDPRFSGNEQLVDTSFPALFRVTDIAVPFASSLSLKTDKQPGAKLHVVMRSSPFAAHLTGDSADLKPFQKWAPKLKGLQQQQFGVAAVAEGTLKSAFPEGDKQGVPAAAESAHPARVFVLASSQFLANPLARAGNGPDMGQYGMMMPGLGGDEQLLLIAGPYAQQFITGTILVFKNALDWLIGDTDLLAVSTKILSDPNLVYGDVAKLRITPDMSEEQIRKQEEELKAAHKDQQRNIEFLLILGIPALFAAYGLARWRMRLAARAHVSLA